MLLFFRFIEDAELFMRWISCFISQKHIPRVSKICSRQNWRIQIEIDNTTSARSDFVVFCDRVYKKLFWRDHISLIAALIQRCDNLTQSFAINGWINPTLSPTSNTISHRQHRLTQTCCIFSALVPFVIVWIQMDPSMKSVWIWLWTSIWSWKLSIETHGRPKNHSSPCLMIVRNLMV